MNLIIIAHHDTNNLTCLLSYLTSPSFQLLIQICYSLMLVYASAVELILMQEIESNIAIYAENTVCKD